MNILFLSREYPPDQIGGVGIYVYEMSRLLAKMGQKTFVITETNDHPLDYTDQGVHVFRIKLMKSYFFDNVSGKVDGFIERLKYSYTISKKINEVVSRYNIDIVESCEARAEGFWYFLFRKKPLLVIKLHTPEGIIFRLNRDSQSRDRQLIEKLEEWWIHRANRLIGLSNSVVNLTWRYYGLKIRDIPIATNPVDIDLFKPYSSLNESNTINILYVGRLEFRKGVHVLIRAIPYVLEKFPCAKFIFIGNDCGMKYYLLNKIREFDINSCVEFLDQIPRNKLVDYYLRSTICVVPSLWENQPYAILEAMACGKPVIASNVGGIPEIIKDKINGMLFHPGSFLNLSKTIVDVLGNRELQKQLGANARKYIEEKYLPINVAEGSLKIYEELLNSVPISA